jgi:hypothetical protein
MNTMIENTTTTNTLAVIAPTALAALRAKAALADAPVWRPVEGEVLEGVIHGSRKVENPFGQIQDQMLVLGLDGGMVAVWLSDWLLKQLRAQTAELGDLMSLSYHGMAKSARGTQYGRYSLTVLKP